MTSARDHSGERDEWLREEYRIRRGPLRITDAHRRPGRAIEPASPRYGWYGELRDEVLEGDHDWDIDAGDDPMEDYGITPPQGERRKAVAWRRRHQEEEAHMEGGAWTSVRRWTWQLCKPMGDTGGILKRPRDRHSWSLRPRMPSCGKT